MSQRPSRTTIDLGPESDAVKQALRALAQALGLTGLSELMRWLAGVYANAPDETAALLEAVRNRASGGDEWQTLADVRDLLPPIALTAQEENGARVGARVHDWMLRQMISPAADPAADFAATDPEGYAALVELLRGDKDDDQ